MLSQRIPVAVAILAVLFACGYLDHRAAVPGIWLGPLGAVFLLLACRELIDLAAARGMQPSPAAVYGGSLLVYAGSWLDFLLPAAPPLLGPLLALALGILLAMLVETLRFREPGGATANLACGVFAVGYLGLSLGLAARLRIDWGLGALVATIFVVKFSDVGAFFVGRYLGRRRLAPRLSPGKTVEGACGALAAAVLAAWLSFTWIVPAIDGAPAIPAPWWGWLAFGLTLAVVGMVGDLAESLLKRDAGRKDSSTWLPGLGGVLDVVDSLLPAAPIAYGFWALGMIGG